MASIFLVSAVDGPLPDLAMADEVSSISADGLVCMCCNAGD